MSRYLALLLLLLLALPACTERSAGPQSLQMADAAFARGEYLEAERLYESYLQAHLEDSGRWRAWTRLLIVSRTIRKSSPRSIQLLEAMHLEFIDEKEKLWEILNDLGEEYRRQGELEKAAAVYQKALDTPGRQPEEYVRARLLLFEIQRRSGHFDVARAVLVEGLDMEMAPEDRAAMLLKLSTMSIYAGELEDAKARLEEIVALGRGESETGIMAVFYLADLAEQSGETERARALFTSILHLHPNPAAVQARLNNLETPPGVPPPG